MKTVLIYSGGLDSTVLLYHLKYRLGHEVKCLSVNYGQRHRKEIEAGQRITFDLGVEHRVADLSGLRWMFAGSSQTSDDISVPDGHYAEESMKQTVVPNRNMMMLALAGSWAVSMKADHVAYGAHSGDHAIYPDCRPEFAEAVEDCLRLCDWHPVKLIRPFLYPTPMSKTDIVRLGAELGVPMGRTWSCYKGGEVHCGTCGTCNERKEAFRDAGVQDPTEYLP